MKNKQFWFATLFLSLAALSIVLVRRSRRTHAEILTLQKRLRPALDVLACPHCHGRLTSLSPSGADGNHCPPCRRVYPVINGIPQFIESAEITGWNRRLAGMYDWFSCGSTHMQFIPIVEYRGFEKTAPHKWNGDSLPKEGDPEALPGHPDGIVTEWSVDPDDWGYFLCKTFDEWLKRDVGKVLVNHFETLVAQHLGLPPQLCIYNEFCGKGVAVEHDGSVFACDHYVYPEYRLGNIMDKPLSTLVFTRTQVKFGYAKNETLPQQCCECPYLTDCWGECPKNRIIRTANGDRPELSLPGN